MSTQFKRILSDTGKDYFAWLTALYGALTASLLTTRSNNAGRVLQVGVSRWAARVDTDMGQRPSRAADGR